MLQISPRAAAPDLSSAYVVRDQRLGPRDVGAFWRRYLALIVGCILAGLAVGELYIALTPSSFVAVSQILIESRRTSGSGAAEAGFAQYSLDTSQIENQIQVIKSNQISKQVVEGMRLGPMQDLAGPAGGLFASLRSLVFNDAPPAVRAGPQAAAMRALSDRLQVRRIGQSYVIEISYWSSDPEVAARICNSVTAAYFSDLLRLRIDTAQNGNEILERRLSTLRQQWAAANEAVRSGTFAPEVLSTAEARVITAAVPPASRSWPYASLTLAFSALLGLFAALLGAAIHQSLDTSIRSRAQIDRELGLEILGVLPRMRWCSPRQLALMIDLRPDSAFAGAVRQLKTSLQLRRARGSLTCIGLTATTRSEGRATVAANLARALAGSGIPTLLIDADLHGHRLSRTLAPETRVGLLEALDGSASLTEVLIRGEPGHPDLIPVRGPMPGSENLLGSEGMRALLATCRQVYGAVLIVLPALEEAPDARAVAPYLDGMILVAAYGERPLHRIADGLRGLESTNVAVLGVVVNKCRRTPLA